MKKTRYPGVQRIDEGRYRVRAKLVHPRTGKTKEVDRVVEARGPAEAAAERERLRQELLDQCEGGPVHRTRLADYARSWLSGKLPGLKASTAHLYAQVLDLHVIPTLGDFYLDALVHRDIVAWRDAQQGRPATINGRLRVLRNMLADARAELALPLDPAERVGGVREAHHLGDDDGNCLSPTELARVLEEARRVVPQWHPFFATLAMTGMRFGEATALRWPDIDEHAGVIRVRRSQWRGRVDTTKTGSQRTLPLARELADVLADHRRAMLQAQAPGFAEGWVFPSRVGTLLQPGASVRKPLARALAAAGIERRFTVHGFRRTFNNLVRQVAAGEVVRSMTGHVTEEMTEHYSHIGVDEKRSAVQQALRLVTGGGDRGGDLGA